MDKTIKSKNNIYTNNTNIRINFKKCISMASNLYFNVM